MSEKVEEKVRENLKDVIDPETNFSIVDMGFIYEIDYEEGEVYVEMTLTSPGCPLHKKFEQDVERKAKEVEEVEEVEVETVFDPPWKPEMMSEEAREKFGF